MFYSSQSYDCVDAIPERLSKKGKPAQRHAQYRKVCVEKDAVSVPQGSLR